MIYLDIDGVILSYLQLKRRDPVDHKPAFKASSVKILNKIISLFGADLCVVSTWARGKNPADLSLFLRSRGLVFNDLTIGDIDKRANYVLAQKESGYKRFLVIDDETHEYYARMDEIGYNRILKVNSYRGLDGYDLVEVERNFTRLMDLTY